MDEKFDDFAKMEVKLKKKHRKNKNESTQFLNLLLKPLTKETNNELLKKCEIDQNLLLKRVSSSDENRRSENDFILKEENDANFSLNDSELNIHKLVHKNSVPNMSEFSFIQAGSTSEKSQSQIKSRYQQDFEEIEKLGKGSFGDVVKVK